MIPRMGKSQAIESLITSGQAATRLGCSIWTIHNMVKDGRLKPAGKVPGATGPYLFNPADVEALAAESQAGAS